MKGQERKWPTYWVGHLRFCYSVLSSGNLIMIKRKLRIICYDCSRYIEIWAAHDHEINRKIEENDWETKVGGSPGNFYERHYCPKHSPE